MQTTVEMLTRIRLVFHLWIENLENLEHFLPETTLGHLSLPTSHVAIAQFVTRTKPVS